MFLVLAHGNHKSLWNKIRTFPYEPRIILNHNTLWHLLFFSKRKYVAFVSRKYQSLDVIIFLVFKARLSLQVLNNRHLCCDGISGGNQTLLGICWKSTGKGILTSADSLLYWLNITDVTTVFVDMQLWKTKHLQKCFPNFRHSNMLSTDRIEIHQSQPLLWPSGLLYIMLAGCDCWISIRYVDNRWDWQKFLKLLRGCFVFQSRVSTKTVVRNVFLMLQSKS